MTKMSGWKMAVIAACIVASAGANAGAQTFNLLASFDNSDGQSPMAPLTQGVDGNFYGTTYYGGSNDNGTVFRVTPGGTLTMLYAFCSKSNCADGSLPKAPLLLASDGNFYGTTFQGGSDDGGLCFFGCGTVFKIDTAGNLTTTYTFCSGGGTCVDGSLPSAGLIQASDGNLYGTTETGGAFGQGTIFKLTLSGALGTVYSFCVGGTGCVDGATPQGGVIQGTDGDLYGTTVYGGKYHAGNVFRVTRSGKLITLHSFCSRAHCIDGAQPIAGLVGASDGNFYGTTPFGGSSSRADCVRGGCGTAFRITPTGELTTLYSFCAEPYCADGLTPTASLIQATDGSVYGTTAGYGGAYGEGTIFDLTPAGDATTLYSFCSQSGCPDGEVPVAGLIQGTDGVFYGTAYAGASGNGTVYSLSTGLGPFVAFVQAFGRTGRQAGILGQGFNGATSVSFNGIPAAFIVRRDTFLTATVPAGATTGYVTVTTPTGTLTSNVKFNVLP